MMSHDHREYLLSRIKAYPQVVDAWTISNLICSLFEAKNGDIKRHAFMGDWFLEAVQPEIDLLIARRDSFWHCAISPTVVRSSSTTFVFETEGYSRWVEATPFNE